MLRFAAPVAAALLVTSISGLAAAGDCPDGDWFCESAPAPQSPTPESGAPADADRPPNQLAEPARPPAPADEARAIRLDVPRVQPVRQRRHRYREWGVNLHAALGLMGNHPAMDADAGMNGLGGALRFRPIHHIAIEGSLDLIWGTDYNGFDRFENGVLVSCMFFLNPRSAVQVYGLAGFGVGGAWVEARDDVTTSRDETYSYLGAQLGAGVEARITRHFVLGGDLLGFLRERNDRHARERPEFVDPVTHRTTNSSGGGLVRLGATYYW